MPELSIIMPTYNEDGNALQTCIDSVLHQTYRDFEFFIIIEPGEKNLTLLDSIASKDPRVVIIRNETKLGVSESRNRGINVSSGKYISLIDGDDYCDIERFQKQVAFLENNPDISVVGSNMHLVDEDNNIIGQRLYPEFSDAIKTRFLYTMTVANPTVMTRHKDLLEVGLYDSRFKKAEDFELWLRFLAHNKKMHNLQDKLVYYRTPLNQNAKRGRVHWENNYIARKRYSHMIWPAPQRVLSLGLYYIISHMPDSWSDKLINMPMLSRIRSVTVNCTCNNH